MIVDVYTNNELVAVYVGGVCYIDLEKNYINISSDFVNFETIHFNKIEIDRTHNHYTVYTE